MKYITIILFQLLSMAVCAQSGGSTCTQPMSELQFREFKTQISRQFNDQNKLSLAQNTLRNNCLLAIQVKEITQMFGNDDTRLEFAKQAFKRTVDKNNFYEVYDAFSRFSVVFRLHDSIRAGMRQGGNFSDNDNNNTYPPYNQDTRFPNLNYPDYANYNGRKSCNFPISESEFERLFSEMQNPSSPGQTTDMNRISSYCLSTAQAMKFATLIQQENIRFEFLRSTVSHVYDVDNYVAVNQLLTNQSYKNSIISLLTPGTTYNPPTNTNTGNCQVPDEEFKKILDRVRGASFDSEKMTTAQTIMKAKKCFTAAQVRELVKLFSFSKSKMDMAKFSYDYTSDKDNYFVVADAFTFAGDKEELFRFIDSKH